MWRSFLSLVLCPASLANNMCQQEGAIAGILNNIDIPTCDEFNPTGPAIRLPSDTATVVHGVLEGGEFGAPVSLRNRDDDTYELSSTLVQDFLDTFTNQNPDDKAQLLVEITFSDGTKASVNGVRPVLFVRKTTVVKPFQGMRFDGQIYNHQPGAGVNEYDSITLQFSDTLVGDDLVGTRISSLGDYSSEALAWYTNKFGLDGGVSLQWYPGMHFPGDSELVLHSVGGPGSGFMDPLVTTPLFLIRTVSQLVHKKPNWSFFVHGTPIFTLQKIDGTFAATPTPKPPQKGNKKRKRSYGYRHRYRQGHGYRNHYKKSYGYRHNFRKSHGLVNV